jgi:hypothetical protein
MSDIDTTIAGDLVVLSIGIVRPAVGMSNLSATAVATAIPASERLCSELK